MIKLTISIVTYKTDEVYLIKCIRSLQISCQQALSTGRIDSVALYLVDNSADEAIFEQVKQLVRQYWSGAFYPLQMPRNIGYGNAHNQAIKQLDSDYHLALNPDVDLQPDTISQAVYYLQNNPDVGMVSPYVENENREYLYLCKRYPSVLVLFLRGFFPNSSRRLFQNKLAYYEMRDCNVLSENKDIMIASGCFMFFRVSILKKLQGFCNKFFLYFEDFDLSYRLSAMSRIAYVPEVKIVHHGGYAAAKGLKHIYFFCRSSLKFFNRFGWSLY